MVKEIQHLLRLFAIYSAVALGAMASVVFVGGMLYSEPFRLTALVIIVAVMCCAILIGIGYSIGIRQAFRISEPLQANPTKIAPEQQRGELQRKLEEVTLKTEHVTTKIQGASLRQRKGLRSRWQHASAETVETTETTREPSLQEGEETLHEPQS